MNCTSLISVIIPVYNGERYINRCVRSIQSQTYTNLEIILIDDGSTDHSLQVMRSIEVDDHRVVVLYKENGGVSSARNLGLSVCSGDYVTFIDCDDLVSPYYISVLFNALQTSNSQIATCHAREFYNEAPVDCLEEITNIAEYTVISVANGYDFQANYMHCTVWGALFRLDIVRSLRFCEDIYVAEDSLFFAQALCRAGRVVDLQENLYYYFRHSGSLSSRAEYSDAKFTEIEAWSRIIKQFIHGPKLSLDSAKVKYAECCSKCIKYMLVYGGFDSDKYSACKRACLHLLPKALARLSGFTRIGYLAVSILPAALIKAIYKDRYVTARKRQAC